MNYLDVISNATSVKIEVSKYYKIATATWKYDPQGCGYVMVSSDVSLFWNFEHTKIEEDVDKVFKLIQNRQQELLESKKWTIR